MRRRYAPKEKEYSKEIKPDARVIDANIMRTGTMYEPVAGIHARFSSTSRIESLAFDVKSALECSGGTTCEFAGSNNASAPA